MQDTGNIKGYKTQHLELRSSGEYLQYKTGVSFWQPCGILVSQKIHS